MKSKFSILVIPLAASLILTGCNLESESKNHPISERILTAQTEDDFDGREELFDQIDADFDALDPVTRGRILDELSYLEDGDVANASMEEAQKSALEHFGLPVEDLDDTSQDFVMAGVTEGVDKQIASQKGTYGYAPCSWENYDETVSYKKYKKKHKKKKIKKYYPTSIRRVVNDHKDKECDFEMVFSKSGRDYIYSKNWRMRRVLKATAHKKKLGARKDETRVIVGYGAMRLWYGKRSNSYYTKKLKGKVFIWKNK